MQQTAGPSFAPRSAGLSGPGVGGALAPKISKDQLTLSQPRGTDFAYHITYYLPSPWFLDLSTALDEGSELTGTVDCWEKLVGVICPLPTLIRIGLIYLPKNCGYGTPYPSAFPAPLTYVIYSVECIVFIQTITKLYYSSTKICFWMTCLKEKSCL